MNYDTRTCPEGHMCPAGTPRLDDQITNCQVSGAGMMRCLRRDSFPMSGKLEPPSGVELLWGASFAKWRLRSLCLVKRTHGRTQAGIQGDALSDLPGSLGFREVWSKLCALYRSGSPAAGGIWLEGCRLAFFVCASLPVYTDRLGLNRRYSEHSTHRQRKSTKTCECCMQIYVKITTVLLLHWTQASQIVNADKCSPTFDFAFNDRSNM